MGSNPATPTSYNPHFLGLVSRMGVRSACCIANGSCKQGPGWPLRPSERGGRPSAANRGVRSGPPACATRDPGPPRRPGGGVPQGPRSPAGHVATGRAASPVPLSACSSERIGHHTLSSGTMGSPRMSDVLAQPADVAIDVAGRTPSPGGSCAGCVPAVDAVNVTFCPGPPVALRRRWHLPRPGSGTGLPV